MAMHKKRKGMGRGMKSSRRSHSKKRGATIESGGRTSDMEQGERA
jgi:hypothetical protein